EQPAVVGLEVFADRIGANTQHDRVKFEEIPGGQVFRGEEVHVNAEIDERLRHFVAGTDDVADVETGCDLHVDPSRSVGRRAVEIVERQARLADGVIDFFVFLVVVGGDGGYGVGFVFKAGGSDTEVQGFVVTILCSGKLLCRGGPTLRQIETDRSFGGAFDVAV